MISPQRSDVKVTVMPDVGRSLSGTMCGLWGSGPGTSAHWHQPSPPSHLHLTLVTSDVAPHWSRPGHVTCSDPIAVEVRASVKRWHLIDFCSITDKLEK